MEYLRLEVNLLNCIVLQYTPSSGIVMYLVFNNLSCQVAHCRKLPDFGCTLLSSIVLIQIFKNCIFRIPRIKIIDTLGFICESSDSY